MKKDAQNNSFEKPLFFIKSFELSFPAILAFKMIYPLKRIVMSCFEVVEPLVSLFPGTEKVFDQFKSGLTEEDLFQRIEENLKEE